MKLKAVNPKVIYALVIVLLLSVFLFKALVSNSNQRQMPVFNLPDLMLDDKSRSAQDLVGSVYLINVWGTWCPTCLIELPYLTKLRERDIKIIGLYLEQRYDPDFDGEFNLQALRDEVSQMLAHTGNPYQFNIFDLNHTLAFDLGVTGAPETFLVDSKGMILLHHIGELNERVWRTKFAAKLAELR